MLLGAVQTTAAPGMAQTISAKASEVKQVMSNATGQPWYAWAFVAGSPQGTFAASSRFEGFDGLATAQQSMAADPAYQQLSSEVAAMVAGPAELTVSTVVATYGELAEPTPVISLTTAALANSGRLAEAMDWAGRATANLHHKTNSTWLLTSSAAGEMFQVGWLGQFNTMSDLDAANDTTATDPEYMALIDEGAPFVIPGSVHRSVAVQIG